MSATVTLPLSEYESLKRKLDGQDKTITRLESELFILRKPQYFDDVLEKNFTVTEYLSGDFGEKGNKVGKIKATDKESAKRIYQKLNNIPDCEIGFYSFNI